jgi:hypothetical protein
MEQENAQSVKGQENPNTCLQPTVALNVMAPATAPFAEAKVKHNQIIRLSVGV